MRKTTLLVLTMFCIFALSGCIYRPAISQGNLIEQEDLDQLEVGMTVNQVRFLLGTPMVDDPFTKLRWDYVYYVKIGRNSAVAKRWISVFFEDEIVSEIRKDLELDPGL